MIRGLIPVLCMTLILGACSSQNNLGIRTTTPKAPLNSTHAVPHTLSPTNQGSTAKNWSTIKLPAGCRFSSISPDLMRVIYLCQDKLWLIKVTEPTSATLIIQDDHLIGTSWSPDGEEFAVGMYHPNQENKYIASLWAYRRDTPSARRLLHQGEFFCNRQLWSPSGKWILVAGGGGKSSDAILVRTDGTGQEDLAPIGIMNWSQGASWSPDNARLAYASDFGEVKDLDVGTGGTTLVYTQTGTVLLFPAWSPDGKMIAILGDSYPGKLVVVDSASKRVLNDWTLPADWKQSTDLFWSPDSKRIAISFFLHGNQIGIISLPSGEMSELPGEAPWPVLEWSKDGLVGFGEEGGQETIETIPVK